MSKKMLIMIIAAFVLIMGMMGGGFFIMWKQMSAAVAQVQQNGGQGGDAQDQADPKDQEVNIGPLYKLDTMIVNLADQGGKRYLRVTMEMELRVADEVEPPELIEEIDKRLPQLRDTVLMILPSKKYTDISTTEGKIALRDEIIAQLNGYLKKGQINTIYFTEFVVQ